MAAGVRPPRVEQITSRADHGQQYKGLQRRPRQKLSRTWPAIKSGERCGGRRKAGRRRGFRQRNPGYARLDSCAQRSLYKSCKEFCTEHTSGRMKLGLCRFDDDEKGGWQTAVRRKGFRPLRSCPGRRRPASGRVVLVPLH